MPAGVVNVAPMGVEWGARRHRPQAVPRHGHLPQRDGRGRGGREPGRRRARVRARGHLQPVVRRRRRRCRDGRAAGRLLLLARAAGAQRGQHAAAVADRDGGRPSRRAARVHRLQPRRATRCSRPRSTRRGCTCWRGTFVEQELARLQVIVDKTAGPAEHEAMALITDYVRSSPVRPRGHVTRARRGGGLRRGARAPALRRAGPARHDGPLVRRHRRGGACADAARLGLARRRAARRRAKTARAPPSSRGACWRTCRPAAAASWARACACTGRCRRTAGLGSGTQLALASRPGADRTARRRRRCAGPGARDGPRQALGDRHLDVRRRRPGRGGRPPRGAGRVGAAPGAPAVSARPGGACVAVPHARAGVSGAGRDAGVRGACRRRPRATSSAWRIWC